MASPSAIRSPELVDASLTFKVVIATDAKSVTIISSAAKVANPVTATRSVLSTPPATSTPVNVTANRALPDCDVMNANRSATASPPRAVKVAIAIRSVPNGYNAVRMANALASRTSKDVAAIAVKRINTIAREDVSTVPIVTIWCRTRPIDTPRNSSV